MTVPTVPDDLAQFVHDEVVSGRFTDPDSVIIHALRQLQRDREEAVLGIERGFRDAAAGRMQPLADAFDDLRRESSASE
ncbi:MAG TPA: hypothetical protein VFG20_21470 [Planctomycetaceae bacterium]|nr:hypothetical protein [Planctomycetaceae bacterium]